MISNNQSTLESVLKKKKFISVTTYKRSGQGVATPVWFVFKDGKIFFRSEINTWKVKRLRNNPSVEFAPCTVIGKIIGPSF
ncbi:MAG: PPOX class F420-dependent oxidoreductase, partial [Candidatus Heimdallarchaeaceae archaeon]